MNSNFEKPKEIDDLIEEILKKIKSLNDKKREEYLNIFNKNMEDDIEHLQKSEGVE